MDMPLMLQRLVDAEPAAVKKGGARNHQSAAPATANSFVAGSRNLEVVWLDHRCKEVRVSPKP